MRTPLFNGLVLESPLEPSKMTFGSKHPEVEVKTSKGAGIEAGQSYLKFSIRKASQ